MYEKYSLSAPAALSMARRPTGERLPRIASSRFWKSQLRTTRFCPAGWIATPIFGLPAASIFRSRIIVLRAALLVWIIGKNWLDPLGSRRIGAAPSPYAPMVTLLKGTLIVLVT